MTNPDFDLEWIGPSSAVEGVMRKEGNKWIVEELVVTEQDGYDIATGEMEVTGTFTEVADALGWVFEHNVERIYVGGIEAEEAARLLADTVLPTDSEVSINDEGFRIADDGTVERY